MPNTSKISIYNPSKNNCLFFDGSILSTRQPKEYRLFGSPMPGRQFNSGSYKYGFNGKENDPETVGTGQGTQDYGMRIYNPALGKFLSVDPIASSYPELTPYQFASNRPISHSDLDGKEGWEEIVAAVTIWEFVTAATAIVVVSNLDIKPIPPISLTYDDKVANPWNIPLTPPVKTNPEIGETFTEDVKPNELGELNRVKPKLPQGGNNAPKWAKGILVGVVTARVAEKAYTKYNENKKEAEKTTKNNAQDINNNKGTTPSANTKAPETNIKPVTTGSTPQKQEKLSDSPKTLQAAPTGNITPVN